LFYAPFKASIAHVFDRFLFAALGHNMFLTGARFATLVTTFSASKIACEATGNMGPELSTGLS
jgi:hypothetical protein